MNDETERKERKPKTIIKKELIYSGQSEMFSQFKIVPK